MKATFLSKAMLGVHKLGFKLQKHSPEILLAAGVVGTVVSAVMACKATTKLSGVLEPAKEELGKIHEAAEAGYISRPAPDESESEKVEYTGEDSRKDLAIVYIQTGVKILKLYAPAVTLGMFSIATVLASNDILRRRNVALAGAYAAVSEGFKEYRSRVVERFGKRTDYELKHGVKVMETGEEKTVTGEDGTERKVKAAVDTVGPDIPSDYARFFDANCPDWNENPEYNMMFLRAQQQYANDLLRSRGRLFLNDVYGMLGIPKSKAGQIVGWVYDPDHPVGDNYVDFGIHEVNRSVTEEEYEQTILLDFNVDGNIWDLM